MSQYWPRWISNPNKTFGAPDKILVKTPDEHQQRHPDDYARFVEELEAAKIPPKTVSRAEAEERERCALIAQNFIPGDKTGLGVAAAIRGDGPEKADVGSDSNPFVLGGVITWDATETAPEAVTAPED